VWKRGLGQLQNIFRLNQNSLFSFLRNSRNEFFFGAKQAFLQHPLARSLLIPVPPDGRGEPGMEVAEASRLTILGEFMVTRNT
jgi:hypothetical protein